jgi:hypothetical protein
VVDQHHIVGTIVGKSSHSARSLGGHLRIAGSDAAELGGGAPTIALLAAGLATSSSARRRRGVLLDETLGT